MYSVRRSEFWRPLARLGALLTLMVGCLALLAPAARAEEAPLRLAFVNSDPSDGMRVYNAVKSVLELSNDLILTDEGIFLSAGANHSVKLEMLRDGDKRKEYAPAFKKTLADAGVEGALVLDVFGGGRTMQFVVIGPDGEELGDIRQRIAGPEPTQAESVEALKNAFKVLVPKIREFRQRKPAPQADVGLIGQDEPPVDDDSIKAQVIAEHRRQHGNLTRGVTPRVGVIFGSRNLNVESEIDYQLSHSSPFFGVGAEIDAILALFDAETAALGATLFVGYAPFTTMLADSSGQSQERASSFLDLRLDLQYIKGIGEGLRVRGILGAEMLAVNIEDNQTYIGNDYISLRAGVGVLYQFGELAELRLEAVALPILRARVSENTLGNSDFALGADLGAALELVAFGPYRATLGYHFKYYGVTYSEPKLVQLRNTPADASDTFHVANIVLGYAF